jgi:hypothetical protein
MGMLGFAKSKSLQKVEILPPDFDVLIPPVVEEIIAGPPLKPVPICVFLVP